MNMGAPLSVPRRLLSVDEYYQLGEAGVLHEDDRVELIEGELIEMVPIGDWHVSLVNILNRLFSRQLLDEEGIVSVQNPVILPPRNAPQPDLVIVTPDCAKRQKVPRAEDVLLLIEIAHSSKDYDRDVKIPIYARFGIVEDWLFDIEAQQLTIFLDPAESGYERVLTPSNAERISPSRLPRVTIGLADVW